MSSKSNDSKKQTKLPIKEAMTEKEIEKSIVDEAIKITKNETSSCYSLVQFTKDLLKMRALKES